MNHLIENTDLPTLLSMYNQEIDILKAKMLNGASWNSLTTHRKQIMRLAVAIHNSCPRVETNSKALRDWEDVSTILI